MKRSLLCPFLLLAIACQDGTPVQPDLGSSALIPPIQTASPTNDLVQMVPFRGHGTWWGTPGEATEAEIAECAAMEGEVDVGAGIMNATHLGRSSYRFLNCWGAAGLLYQAGRIRAANGDELTYFGPEAEGWEVFEVDWSGGAYEIGLVRFTGGTGRFENVTGSFTTLGVALVGDEGWYGTELWEGVISSVGSSN